MTYEPGDVAWLLTQWQNSMKAGGEYITWRGLVGRYPGKSDLSWLWGLVATAVDRGYLVVTPGTLAPPDPDSRVSWDGWQLTESGRQLVAAEPTA
jgi:hypothetical protein